MSKVTIYSTKTCGYCNMLKQYLDNKDVAYEVKMADENPAYVQELYEKSGQLGVPFTIVESDSGEVRTILGFDRLKIDSALGI